MHSMNFGYKELPSIQQGLTKLNTPDNDVTFSTLIKLYMYHLLSRCAGSLQEGSGRVLMVSCGGSVRGAGGLSGT